MNKKTDNIYDAKRQLEEYRKYARQLELNQFKTGVDQIDQEIRGVAGGEVMTIMARAGCFKTAKLQNMLKKHIKNSDQAALFFSIEMAVPQVTERFQSMVSGVTGREIESLYRSGDAEKKKMVAQLEQAYMRDLENLFIIPTKVSISDIAQYVKLTEQGFDVKVGVIGIDYLGLMDGRGSGEYEIVSQLSKDAKILAKDINLPVVLLSQVNRKGGDGQQEITLDMGRGSGAIEEGADFVLGMYQEQGSSFTEGSLNIEHRLICKILKNRKGRKDTRWLLDIDPSTFSIGSRATEHVPCNAVGGSRFEL